MSSKVRPNTSWYAVPPLAIIALSIAYFLVIFLPSKERMRNDLEKEKIRLEANDKKNKEEKLQNCLDAAKNRFSSDFDLNVKKIGNKDGSLPYYLVEQFNKTLNDEQELCVKKYK